MADNQFGRWLRTWRKARRKTQAELAAEIGYTDSYISALERNASEKVKGDPIRPSEEFVEKAATALGRPVEEGRALAGYFPSPAPVTVNELKATGYTATPEGTISTFDATAVAKELFRLIKEAQEKENISAK